MREAGRSLCLGPGLASVKKVRGDKKEISGRGEDVDTDHLGVHGSGGGEGEVRGR